MKNNTNTNSKQKAKNYGTHIRVPIMIKHKIARIARQSGKKQLTVAKELITLGINEYSRVELFRLGLVEDNSLALKDDNVSNNKRPFVDKTGKQHTKSSI